MLQLFFSQNAMHSEIKVYKQITSESLRSPLDIMNWQNGKYYNHENTHQCELHTMEDQFLLVIQSNSLANDHGGDHYY